MENTKRRWTIKYKGWIITHDPYGALACYRMGDTPLCWCYFGCSVDVIKRQIDKREYLAGLEG